MADILPFNTFYMLAQRGQNYEHVHIIPLRKHNFHMSKYQFQSKFVEVVKKIVKVEYKFVEVELKLVEVEIAIRGRSRQTNRRSRMLKISSSSMIIFL
jgi:hypothetical protein